MKIVKLLASLTGYLLYALINFIATVALLRFVESGRYSS
jgi:multisubunit Na+/H+ antiporter MnhF subunit